MIEFGQRAQTWLIHSLAASGFVLLLAALLMLIVRQPARRRQIGSWSIRAALLVPLLALAPSWLMVPLPERTALPVVVQPVAPERAVPSSAREAAPARPEAPIFALFLPNEVQLAERSQAIAPPADQPSTTVQEPAPTARALRLPIETLLLIGYAAIAAVLMIRWLLGHLALRRMVARASVPDNRLAELFAGQAAGQHSGVRLRVAQRLRVPVCCGLWRPTVLLPAGLARCADDRTLRWVFAHELAHLRRGDPWTCFWFGLGQALFFPLPWFWWLKRQVGLCQEFLADAAAAGLAARVEDYADFLVSLSRAVVRPHHQLAAATGVLGNSSDLFRRITMLLRNEPLEGRCPRRWSLLAAGGFLGLAIVLAGVGVGRETIAAPVNLRADEQEKKDEPKKDQPKKDETKKGEAKKAAKPKDDFDALQLQIPPEGLDPQELQRQMQKIMGEVNKRLQQQIPGAMIAPLVPGADLRLPGRRHGSVRLGASIEKPSDVLVEQLDLPKGQGLVVGDVTADSAAAKAGLKPNDILLELGGKSVPSDPQEFRKQLAEIKANSPVDATVLRKGKKETLKGMSLPEAKNEAGFEGLPGFDFQAIPNVNFPELPAVPKFPNVPNIHLPRPVMPGIDFPHMAPGVKGTSLHVVNGSFSVRTQEGDQDTSVSGEITDGKVRVSRVEIRDGNDRVNVDKLESVPEKYREQVQKLLKMVEPKK